MLQVLAPGRWNVFCGSFNASTKRITIMLNGVISKDAVDPTMVDSTLNMKDVLGSLRIGGGIPYGDILYSHPFTGKVTDLNIWARALDVTEMKGMQVSEEEVKVMCPG